MLFTYKRTNADAALGRVMFFSYWMSRELALHARHTLKNPYLLASYYRFYEGWSRIAEEEGYPDSVKGTFSYLFNTSGGWAAAVWPADLFIPFTMLGEMMAERDEDRALMDKLSVFFNPVVQAAGAVWGLTERTPDITATYKVRGIARTFADYMSSNWGVDVLSHFGGSADGALDEIQRRVYQRLNEVMTTYDFPGAEEYTPFDPETHQIDMLRSVVMANAAAAGIPADDPRVLDAFAAIKANDYESNPLAEAAFKEYTTQRFLGDFAGLLLPNTQRYRPRDEDILANRAFGEAIGAGQEPTEEQEAADLRRTLASASDPQLVTEQEQYRDLGTERQRALHAGWTDVAYGDDWIGHYLVAGGRSITGDDLMSLDEDERILLADQWVADQQGTEELEGYRKLRDDFIKEHPTFAEYDEYRDLVFAYEGGARAFRREMAKTHPEFADELNEARERFKGYGHTGAVLEAELDQWVTSRSGYHAFRGERANVYDEAPEQAYDPTSDPYLGVREPEAEGGRQAPQSTAAELAEDIAEYREKAARMEAVLGAPVESFANPLVRDALERQYGDDWPRMTQLMIAYQQWVTLQPTGSDTSPEAFGRYMEELERQEELRLIPAA